LVDQIVVRTDYERDALELLKKQSYGHAKRFDAEFLMMTGLRQDMNRAFTAMGWSLFTDITEPGSHLLTMEFLSTLHVETVGKETKIHFHFFNEFFEMLLRDFSNALGFSKKCLLEANALTDDLEYDRSAWSNEISDEPVSSKNSIVSIHNPTLRVLAKYLAMVVFCRADFRLCSSSEIMCLYAMAKKIRYSPVMGMVAHWQKMITCKSPIDITSLVTCIARYVGVLENAQVTYLPAMDEYRTFIGLDHFVHAHMMCEGPGNSVFMCYTGYEKEFELPCPKFSLYSVKRLTLRMEKKEPARHNTAGPMTRGRTRCDAQLAEGGTSRQEFPVRQAHPARQELLSSQELHGRPVLLRKPDHHMLHPRQMPQHSLTQTPLT